jgi:hypothetical protein
VGLSKAEREVFWRQSELTITEFCRKRGLTESAFHLWKRCNWATGRCDAEKLIFDDYSEFC